MCELNLSIITDGDPFISPGRRFMMTVSIVKQPCNVKELTRKEDLYFPFQVT